MTVHVLAPFEQCLFPCMTLVIFKKQKQSNERTNQKSKHKTTTQPPLPTLKISFATLRVSNLNFSIKIKVQ